MERSVPDINAVAHRQLFEIRRQLLGLRQFGIVEQHRDHRNVAGQRGGDLDPHKVVFIVEPALAVLIEDCGPVRTDHGKQDVAFRDFVAQHFDEIQAERNGVDIHEQKVAAELPLQPVAQAPGMTGTVVTAIADEEFTGHDPS